MRRQPSYQAEPEQPGISATAGPEAMAITLQINGAARTLRVEPRMTLAEALRGPLGLTGTKIACNRGACSACTVWLDGVADLLLHDAGHRCRRAWRYDDRRAGATATRSIRYSGLHRA